MNNHIRAQFDKEIEAKPKAYVDKPEGQMDKGIGFFTFRDDC